MKILLKTAVLTLSVVLLISCKKERRELPSVKTLEVTDITATTAVCGGEADESYKDHRDARMNLCWSATDPIPYKMDFPVQVGYRKDSANFYRQEIHGLSPDTKYYVRVYIWDGHGERYGDVKEFTTLPE